MQYIDESMVSFVLHITFVPTAIYTIIAIMYSQAKHDCVSIHDPPCADSHSLFHEVASELTTDCYVWHC